MKYPLVTTFSVAACVTAFGLSSSFGVLTFVNHSDAVGHCDELFVPDVVDELGENSDGGPIGGGSGFPIDELISVEFLGLGNPSCLATNGPGLDLVIAITNETQQWQFTDLWYVADSITTITNYDGFVSQVPPGNEQLLAFKIDTAGVNTPLISESINANGIFEVGETWEFVLQDFGSIIAPQLLQSVGLGVNSPSPPADDASSGSIIATPDPNPIPEPSRAILLSAGLIATLLRRRRA